MSNRRNITNSRQVLEKLARGIPAEAAEVSAVTSPGARTTAWAVKVKGHYSYNVYDVRAVEIGEPGSLPTELGEQMQATNLAESFLEQGQLPAGTYTVISRVGSKNVFYVPV